MSQTQNENITNPFSDELEPAGDRYIEKFQEVLFRHSTPPQNLLDSLKNQPKQTLLNLRDLMDDLAANAENAEVGTKYNQVIEHINNIIDAPQA